MVGNLTLSFVLVLAVSITCTSSQSCSGQAIETYLQKRADAKTDVINFLHVNLLHGMVVNSNGSNDTTEQLYSALTAANNVTESVIGLRDFGDALKEVTDSYFVACQGSDSVESKVVLLTRFVNSVAANFSDFSNVRSDYGKLLCYQLGEEGKKTSPLKQKRASSLTDCSASSTIQALHECLDPFNIWPCIFNIDPSSNDCPSNIATSQARNCIAFVIDTTGSMADEIAAARQIIKQFIQSEDNILTLCYIMVAFNDYLKDDYEENLEFYKVYDANYNSNDEGSVPHFSVQGGTVKVFGTNTLLTDVNSLRAHGGFDCPEFGMIGILKAIELINSIDDPQVKMSGKHNVIVLTDASASDNELYPYVIGNATASNEADITVHFFFSDEDGCWCCPSGYGNFPDIANATCGFAVHSIDTQAFIAFAGYLYSAQQSASYGLESCSEVGNVGGGNVGANCKSFNISLFAVKFSFLIQSSINNPIMTITLPDNSSETVTINGDFGVYQKSNQPQQGEWSICLSTGLVLDFSLSITLDLEFILNYVSYDSQAFQFYPISNIPFSCDKAYLIVEVKQIEKIDFSQPLMFQLVHVNGTVEVEAKLIKCGEAIIGSFTVPSTSSPLFYQIQGKDIGGIRFQETVSNPITFPMSTLILTAASEILLSANGRTMFKFMLQTDTSRKQPIPVTTQWSLVTGNGSTILHQGHPLNTNITSNGQYIDVSLSDLNEVIDQQIYWTLTANDQCSGQVYSLSLPAIRGPSLVMSASNSCSSDVALNWNNVGNTEVSVHHYNVSLEFTNGTVLQLFTSLSQPGLILSNLPYKETLLTVVKAAFNGGQVTYQPFSLWTNADVPSSPMNMKARLLNSAVELEWSPPDCWNSKEIHYIVYYRNEEELEWEEHTVLLPTSNLSATVTASITNLDPGKYIFKVAGVNPVGVGVTSSEVTVTVYEEKGQSAVIVVAIAIGVPICTMIIVATSCTLLFIVVVSCIRRKRVKERDTAESETRLSDADSEYPSYYYR